MRSIFDQAYRLTGWFSRLLTLPGWFDQELTEDVAAQVYTLSAEGGAFAFTGADATFVVTPEVGYTAIGRQKIAPRRPKPILRHYTLRAEGARITLSVANATMRRGYGVQALGASFLLAGTAASLHKHPMLTAYGAQFVLDGADATVIMHRSMHSAAGHAAFTGAAAMFVVDRARMRARLAALDDEWLFLEEVA